MCVFSSHVLDSNKAVGHTYAVDVLNMRYHTVHPRFQESCCERAASYTRLICVSVPISLECSPIFHQEHDGRWLPVGPPLFFALVEDPVRSNSVSRVEPAKSKPTSPGRGLRPSL